MGDEMKTIVLNASPRKTWNTAKLLKSAAKGAEDAGAQVTYIDLYDLNFTGCPAACSVREKAFRDATATGGTIFHQSLIRSLLRM